MSDLSIKVNIAGRTYPLTIKREEEEGVRKAAGKINADVKHLEDNYAVRDKQDLLAMVALQLANKLEAASGTKVGDQVLSALREIDDKLTEFTNE